MQLVMFTKSVKDKSVNELITLAHDMGLEGYDLCVRPEYPINPDNAGAELTKAVRTLNGDGLAVPMVTGNFDLLLPDHPTAEPILGAMDAADVRLIKLGYFDFDPLKQDYWQEVDRIRTAFEGWAKLGEKHNVKICYHTHCGPLMGRNAGMMAHLVQGFDPRHIGTYMDPSHLVVEGEAFEHAIAIVKEYLSIIGLKDVMLTREEKSGHGSVVPHMIAAGQGMVDWTAVFAELVRISFDGPMSIHCEHEVAPDEYLAALKHEVTFFKSIRAAAT